MKINNSVGVRVEELRAYEGITREEFAEKIGCTHEYVRMIEQGKKIPREPLLLAMCYRFGVGEKWLKTGTGKRRN